MSFVTTFALAIPNKNQSCYINTALESLRHQENVYQLAVVDAGSTDGFDQTIKPYMDKIAYLRSSPDAGQAAAIREGISIVEGDIVAWLNADDYYFPQTLDKVLKFFEARPDIDVVYGDAIHVSTECMFLSYFPVTQEFNAADLTRTCFICQPACFVRRSAYEKAGGIDPTLHYTMDWDLWCRLSISGAKFFYLKEVLAAVRYYPGTKTLSGDLSRYKEIWRVERKYGHRTIPLSLLGAYRFDLGLHETRSRFEKAALSILNNLRRIRRKILPKNIPSDHNIKSNYGFFPLYNQVDDCGIIHLPWYNPRKWVALQLKIHPQTDNYQVKINGRTCQNLRFENGHLWVQTYPLDTPHREISIRCNETKHWRLLAFNCELE